MTAPGRPPAGFAASLGVGREFDVIRELARRWGEAAEGLGDDCAVLSVPEGELLVVSTDTSVEHVHFRGDWLSPREIGYRATAAALSDLAAMAARPLGVLVAMSLPAVWREAATALGDGIGDAVRLAETHVLGGDTTGGTELSLTLTVLGAAATPLRRGGARPGSTVYVTGQLGGPSAALRALMRGQVPRPADRARFAYPVARLPEARWLAARGAEAAIDISDGLSSDVGHVAAASAVTIELELDRVPCVPGVDPLEAVASGEEYELAITAPGELDAAAFTAEFGVPLTPIGRVADAARVGGAVIATLGGKRVALPGGYDHFSR